MSDTDNNLTNPFTFLSKYFDYPISLMAALETHGGIISGSLSLQFFRNMKEGRKDKKGKKGKKDKKDKKDIKSHTEESDIDLYLPKVTEAVYDIVHILNKSGIRWFNKLSRRVSEVERFGMTFIPSSWIVQLADKALGTDVYDRSKLEVYLTRELDFCESWWIPDFITRLCDACESWRDAPSQEANAAVIWVFRIDGQRTEANFVPVPSMVENAVGEICLIGKRDETSARKLDITARRKFLRQLLYPRQAINAWLLVGLHRSLLDRYLAYRVIEEVRYIPRSTVYAMVQQYLGSNAMEASSGVAYMFFRKLQGTLKGGKKIQVIFLSAKGRQAVRTVLAYYGTHVMSFISGSCGAHLYIKDANAGVCRLFDFHDDPRQPMIPSIEEKWEGRGWTIKRKNRSVWPRNMIDRDCKLVNFKRFYEEAFKEREDWCSPSTLRSGGILIDSWRSSLPRYWDDMMEDQTNQLKRFFWQEENRKITWIRDTNSNPRRLYPQTLLQWVQSCLTTHKFVIDKTTWSDRSEVEIDLQLFLSGVPHLTEAHEVSMYNIL